jgi:hypothetical protein
VNPGKFFRELKRRNVYRAAVGYAAISWLIVQVAASLSPVFDIPIWAVRLIIVHRGLKRIHRLAQLREQVCLGKAIAGLLHGRLEIRPVSEGAGITCRLNRTASR